MSATDLERAAARPIALVPRLIVASRRLQLPLYVQTVIHFTFLLSAMAVAIDRLMIGAGKLAREHA